MGLASCREAMDVWEVERKEDRVEKDWEKWTRGGPIRGTKVLVD